MAWSGGNYTKGNNATGGWVGDASLGIGIEAGRHDTQDDDFATGINQCLNKDGSNAATGNLNLGGNKLTNVAVGTVSTDAITLGQAQAGIDQARTTTNYILSKFSADNAGINHIFQKSRGATVGTNTTVQSNDGLGAIVWQGANGTSYNNAAAIYCDVDQTPGLNDMPGRLVFATTPDGTSGVVERMRITNDGSVAIGGSPRNAMKLDVKGRLAIGSGNTDAELVWTRPANADQTAWDLAVRTDVGGSNEDLKLMRFVGNAYQGIATQWTSAGQVLIGKSSAVTSGTGSYFDPTVAGYPAILVNCKTWSGNLLALQNHHNGTYVGGINYSDTATSFPTSSDYRLKENIVDIDDALGRVAQLKPCRFNFIIKPDETIDGFIAHEVQSVVPNAVEGEKDAVNEDGSIKVQSLDNSKLVPLLTAAIQELSAKVESLEARIAALEA